jgi:hypothetical protein
MSAKAPTLAALQASFQHAILTGDSEAILALIPDNSRTTRDILLNVYANAYQARLVQVVATDHPLLHAYAGDETFEAMARAYIAARPSHTPNARWFSAGFPDFVSETEPFCDHPQLADLARLEQGLNAAFDAPDAPVLSLADLSTVPTNCWEDLVLAPHPSTARLDLATNAYAIWSALKAEDTPPEAERVSEPGRVLIWRQDVAPMMRRIGAEEAMMWDEAVKGVRFGALCELIAIFDGADTAALRAAQYLQSWLSGGLLMQVRMQSKQVPVAATHC